MSAKIEKIIIKINEIEVALTLDEAKGLLKALQDLVGEKEVRVIEKVIEHDYYRDYYPWRWYPVSWYGTTTADYTPKITWDGTATIMYIGDTNPVLTSA